MAILNGADIYFALLKGQGFEHKGDYDAAAVYENTKQRIDCVMYNGTTYYVKKTAPAGTLPTNTAYFGILAKRGNDGANGADGADTEARADIAALQEDVAGLIEDVANIQGVTVISFNSGDYKGHIKFSNGLIINWGGGGANMPAQYNNSITFDCPFATTNYSVVATHCDNNEDTEESALNAIKVARRTNTYFAVQRAFSSANEGISFIAIGV